MSPAFAGLPCEASYEFGTFLLTLFFNAKSMQQKKYSEFLACIFECSYSFAGRDALNATSLQSTLCIKTYMT
jgi:hypothetical protein